MWPVIIRLPFNNILKIYYLIRIKNDLCFELKDQSKNITQIY